MYFYFVNGMFYMSIYSFAQEHADNNKFITDLYALEKLLSTKYGNPFEANEYWLNDRYKDDHAYHGIAVALGHYSIFRSWQDAETTLTLQLTGDNHEIRLSLIYKSTRLQSLAAAKRESDMLDGL